MLDSEHVDAGLAALHQFVRQRIDAGELPYEPRTEKLWAGKGEGGLCSAG
jgi:hypothetical protein